MTRRSGGVPVAWASGATFLAIFGGLALQLRHGRDPIVGGAHQSASAVVAPRRVLIRRVIERRVIVQVIPPAQGRAAPGEAPATTASAPVIKTTAPAAPAAPPSAPAPAPMPTTRSS